MQNFNYTRGIPFLTHDPSNDQPPMQTNTNSVDDLIDVDHYSFGENFGGGHRQVQMPVLGAIPSGLISGEGTLYTKTSGESSLFYSPDATTNQYQLTRTITADYSKFAGDVAIVCSGGSGSGTGGWTFLPGGILLQYGLIVFKTQTAITFPTSFTADATTFGLTLGSDNGDSGATTFSYKSLTRTGVTLQNSTTTAVNRSVFFMAIGV